MLAYIMLYFAFALHISLENRSPQEQDRREYIMLRGFWGITRNQCISTKRLNQERPWVRRHFALHGTLFKIPAPNRQRDSIRDVTQCTHGSYEFSELKPSQANEIFQISPMCYASSSSREHATLERHVRYRCY